MSAFSYTSIGFPHLATYKSGLNDNDMNAAYQWIHTFNTF